MIEVLLSLAQKLDEDDGGKSVRLRADPVRMPEQDINKCLIEEVLIGLSSG